MRTKILLIFILLSVRVLAQENTFSLPAAIEYALKNNAGIRAVGYEVESQRQMKKVAFDLPKTDVTLLYGQYNSYADNDNNITVTQSIPFSSFGSQGKLNRSLVASSELKKEYSENELVYQVKQAYNALAYAYSIHKLLLQQDSIFQGFYTAASLRFKAGETNLLEQTTAESQRNQAKIRIRENEGEIAVLRSQLKGLLNAQELPDIEDKDVTQIDVSIPFDTSILLANPSLAYVRQQIDVARSEKKVQAAKSAPDLLLGFFSQTLIGTPNPETGSIANSSERFTGFQIGISIPLWFVPHQGKIRASEYNKRAAEGNYESFKQKLKSQLDQAIQQLQMTKTSLDYYQSSALPNAELILKQTQTAFKGGEIGYGEFLLGLRNAIEIREGYLQTLYTYNQSVIQIEFLSGNK